MMRNGLLWCDAIESAWEAWALAIGVDKDGNFVVVVSTPIAELQGCRPLSDLMLLDPRG